MANNYYERGDRLNVYLAAELPEEMTGQQDTRHICGNCAWYSFRKLESTCGKTGREVAYFATRECFTTEKDTTMEENTNAQPVAETGTQVCKECGRTLPLEEFQRRRYGKRDTVCKACRAEKIRVGMARKKAAKVEFPEKIAKAVSAPSPAREVVLEEAMKTEGCKGVSGHKDPAGVCLADFSDAALLEELRRRGYKGKLAKVQEVEI